MNISWEISPDKKLQRLKSPRIPWLHRGTGLAAALSLVLDILKIYHGAFK